jgi:molybdopterin molybdotransferase
MLDPTAPQRIARLTPLADALACLDRLVAPVAPIAIEPRHALGRVLAADVTAVGTMPGRPFALRDGFALSADATLDASSYAPALLPHPPEAVEVGDVMPPDADAVAPIEMVELDPVPRVFAPLVPGDGVLCRGADAVDGELLRHRGEPLRRTDIHALARLHLHHIKVRQPRVRLAPVRSHDWVLGNIAALIASEIDTEGGVAATPENTGDIDAALGDRDAHAVILIGGSGGGARDRSVRALAQRGHVAFHGLGLAPGETAAFGTMGERPVLIVPGRFDAALAVWLVLGRHMLARLCGRTHDHSGTDVVLARKVASTLGLAEVVPVKREADGLVPLASGYLPLQALARADGYIVVPAESEGYPAGTKVEMRPLP